MWLLNAVTGSTDTLGNGTPDVQAAFENIPGKPMCYLTLSVESGSECITSKEQSKGFG